MTRKVFRYLLVVLATVVGLYPGSYFLNDRKFGLLSSKSAEWLENTFWNLGFYIHILFGGLALLIGWTQFSSKIRAKNLAFHRRIGKLYITAAILSSGAGIFIGFFATGGILASLGFIFLGLIWFSTTILAYLEIKNGQISKHQKMMIYSYAACFAAVTLRIWLPLLIVIFGDFIIAYTIAAWWCWVPNLLIAGLIARRNKTQDK